MQPLIPLLALAGSALAISDSSSDSAASSAVVPSSFVYSNSSSPLTRGAEASSSSKKARSTIYDYATATDIDEEEVTRTVCSAGSCYVTTDVESKTTYTTTVDGVLTVITTEVPASATSGTAALGAVATSASSAGSSAASAASGSSSAAAATSTASTAPGSKGANAVSSAPGSVVTGYITKDATATEYATTVITITSCSDNKCSKEVVTTGLTTVTEDFTTYTTYCPLTAEEHTSSQAAAATTPVPAPSAGTETKTDIQHTVVTITSCSDNKCTEIPQTTGLTTVTENDTVYTTYCPLTAEEAASSHAPAPAPSGTTETTTDVHHTVVTITSCSDNKCTEIPQTTGVTTVTENDTIYTTFCPLSTETQPPAPATTKATETVKSTHTEAAESTSVTEVSTINVISDNIQTQTPPSSTLVHSTSKVSPPAPSSVVVPPYEGGAAAATFTGMIAFLGSLVFFM